MHQGYVPDGELFARPGRKFRHLLRRHFFIRFVIEVERLAAAGVIPDNPVEYDDRAILSLFDGVNQGLRIDWLTGEGSGIRTLL